MKPGDQLSKISMLMKLRNEHVDNSIDFQVVNLSEVKDFRIFGKPVGTIYARSDSAATLE